MALITHISIARRYKTFVGLVKYSNGAVSSLPLFNGANIGSYIKITPYIKNPKIFFFEYFKAGHYVPVAYVLVMNCFFNITYTRYAQAQFCRAAGTYCILLRFNMDKGYCAVKLPSNKQHILLESCYVMLGRNSNILPKGILIGKAGININKGFRPIVRGVAKNPVDHPHGGRTKTNSPELTP